MKMGPLDKISTEMDSNIIKMPDLKYEPNPRGMGYEFFHSMSKFKNRVAQIEAETGNKDTYDSLLKRCIRTAMGLQYYGITRDDLVCLCTNNHLNSCVPFIATLFLGARVASLDPSLSLSDTKHLISQVNPKIVFVVPNAEKLIEEALEKANIDAKIVVFGKSTSNLEFEDEFLKPYDDEDNFVPIGVENTKETAVIFFSSGTTGLPKGICTNHYAMLCQAANMVYVMETTEVADALVKFSCRNNGAVTSVTLAYSSLYWISSALMLTCSIISGTTRLICSCFDPSEIWHYIEKYKVSFLFMAPNQAVDMYKAGRPEGVDTTSLLEVVIGGAPISKNQLMEFRDVLPGTNVTQGYGQTEVAGVLTVFRPNDRQDNINLLEKLESCGRPVDGIWYKVVDPETEEILGPNQEGELRLKTKFVMNGYHNMDSSNAWDSDGWLKTGDVVYYDEKYYFYIVDRIKEMLKFRSWHVAPAALEKVIAAHPAVHTAIVVGLPDPEDGDHPFAFVVLNKNASNVIPEDIIKFVEERVDDRQRLRGGVKIVDNIPVTPTGKMKRRELRDMVLKDLI